MRDLELLLESHHPLILIASDEDDRVGALLEHVADKLGLSLFQWTAHSGLEPVGSSIAVPSGTDDPAAALDHVALYHGEAVFHLRGFGRHLEEPAIVARLESAYERLWRHRGAIVLSGSGVVLPRELEARFAVVELAPPSPAEYHRFVSGVIRDIRRRRDVKVELTGEDVHVLLSHMRGLSLFEVRKIVTQAVIEDGRLSREDIQAVLDAKKRIIQRSGVLDYYPADDALEDVAGLDALKEWLRKRKLAFTEPERARGFGLSPPRGLLLLGVQGCGKSMCAKAVAREWGQPLIRLDPSNLYNKFWGESEKNLRRAIATAESMAPIVLWIDEIEKAFGGEDDSGTSQRIFGTFLTWLNDKKDSVFVIATANDISRLPPELMRKGRFDEIFFVDLPDAETRRRIFELHLARRNRTLAAESLDALGAATEGFSGAEIEQVVVSALYTAFSEHRDLDEALILAEIRATRPLSVTMSEKIDALRAWAADRAVPAG